MASRLELRRWRDLPGFLVAALRLRRRFRRAPGAVRLGLAVQPPSRVFWTCSSWTDHQALRGFVREELHVAVMARFGGERVASEFTDWVTPAEAPPPSWAEVRRRLARAPEEAPPSAGRRAASAHR